MYVVKGMLRVQVGILSSEICVAAGLWYLKLHVFHSILQRNVLVCTARYPNRMIIEANPFNCIH